MNERDEDEADFEHDFEFLDCNNGHILSGT